MAILSPLAEHLIVAGNLRTWHTPAQAMEALVVVLGLLGEVGYELVEMDITVRRPSPRQLTPYALQEHTIRAVARKGDMFDLHGKGAARIADRAAARLYAGWDLLEVKRHGKPRILTLLPAPANPHASGSDFRRMLDAGLAWKSQRQARALEAQTRSAAPIQPAPRNRL